MRAHDKLPPAEPHHPQGWADPAVHGLATKLQLGPDAD